MCHPYSINRLTAGIVPTPSKCSAREDGMASMPPSHVPSGTCCIASIKAGRCVKGRDVTLSASAGVSRATSVSARNLMAGPAWVSSQSSGNRTGVDGGGGAGGGEGGATGGTRGPPAVTAADDVGVALAGRVGLFGDDGRVTRGSQSWRSTERGCRTERLGGRRVSIADSPAPARGGSISCFAVTTYVYAPISILPRVRQ